MSYRVLLLIDQRLLFDTHVFRVSNRLRLAEGATPNEVEKGLQKAIPMEKWSDAHHWLIWHGRKICRARKTVVWRMSIKRTVPISCN